eukprot:2372458-Rhodomonas_salina.1
MEVQGHVPSPLLHDLHLWTAEDDEIGPDVTSVTVREGDETGRYCANGERGGCCAVQFHIEFHIVPRNSAQNLKPGPPSSPCGWCARVASSQLLCRFCAVKSTHKTAASVPRVPGMHLIPPRTPLCRVNANKCLLGTRCTSKLGSRN